MEAKLKTSDDILLSIGQCLYDSPVWISLMRFSHGTSLIDPIWGLLLAAIYTPTSILYESYQILHSLYYFRHIDFVLLDLMWNLLGWTLLFDMFGNHFFTEYNSAKLKIIWLFGLFLFIIMEFSLVFVRGLKANILTISFFRLVLKIVIFLSLAQYIIKWFWPPYARRYGNYSLDVFFRVFNAHDDVFRNSTDFGNLVHY